ncbi:MAG: hypothetical protein K9M82_03880 [Deltaproteobacteria bacterium]|nr:hypothetical protein [Deltaproteobacteria bacterium]
MKCPKCGYVSFDHNQTCPKCKKDISEERNKLNLPGFEPAVPFLLGALTGEADEVGMNIDIPSSHGPVVPPAGESVGVEEEIPIFEEEEDVASLDEDLEISLEDDWTSEEIEEEPVVSGDLSELETVRGLGEEAADPGEADDDLSLELEAEEESVVDEDELDLSSLAESGDVEEDEISLDLEDLSPEAGVSEEPEPDMAAGTGTDEDLSLELEELQPEEEMPENLQPEEASAGADEELSLDLDELSLDEDELTEDVIFEDSSPTEEEQEPEIELEAIALDEADGPSAGEESVEEEEEVVLNLDDLKVNETGELEIGSPQMEAALGGQDAVSAEETIDLEGIELEQGDEEPADAGLGAGEPEDFTMSLDDLSLDDESEPSQENEEGELSLDLDDLELDLDLEEEEPR